MRARFLLYGLGLAGSKGSPGDAIHLHKIEALNGQAKGRIGDERFDGQT